MTGQFGKKGDVSKKSVSSKNGKLGENMNFRQFARYIGLLSSVIERFNRPARKERQRREKHIHPLDVYVRTDESQSNKTTQIGENHEKTTQDEQT